MEVEVEWDEHNWPKCAKHGVSKAEIEYVLLHNPLTTPDVYEAEPRFRAVGKNANGRYVFIVYCRRNTKVRPIGARYMHRSEIVRYGTLVERK